jgi:hypothetical protein
MDNENAKGWGYLEGSGWLNSTDAVRSGPSQGPCPGTASTSEGEGSGVAPEVFQRRAAPGPSLCTLGDIAWLAVVFVVAWVGAWLLGT